MAFVLPAQNTNPDGGFTPEFMVGEQYIIKTTVGTTHKGHVVSETRESVVIENRRLNEKVEIKKSNILSAKPVWDKKKTDDEPLGKNQHADSYLFSCSAFEFNPSEIQSRNHWLLLQNVDYALSPNMAVTTNAFAFYPISVGLKLNFKVGDNDYVGGSAFTMGNLLNTNPNNPTFWGYAVCGRYTHGSSNRNLTASAGLLGLNSVLLSAPGAPTVINLPFLSLSYCNRFNSDVAFVTEGWYFPLANSLIGGAGVKLVGNDNYSWTFGVFSVIENFDSNAKINVGKVPIPYLGIGRKF
jgi:hypothetical protein